MPSIKREKNLRKMSTKTKNIYIYIYLPSLGYLLQQKKKKEKTIIVVSFLLEFTISFYFLVHV
jgi:hypothetical protein